MAKKLTALTAKWAKVGPPPADVVSRINTAVNQVLQDKDVMADFARLGIEAAGGTPDQFGKMVAVDRAKWKKIITERKITNE